MRGVVQCAGTERDRIMVNVLAVGEHEPFDTCMLDSASAFVSERLRAGRYVVRAVRAMTCAGEGYSVTRLVAARVGDGVADRAVEREVLLADGADVEVELTVPQAAFGTLHGRLAVAGVTTPFDSVCLVTEEGGGVCGEFALQRDGSFVAADVLVGRYRLSSRWNLGLVSKCTVCTRAELSTWVIAGTSLRTTFSLSKPGFA